MHLLLSFYIKSVTFLLSLEQDTLLKIVANFVLSIWGYCRTGVAVVRTKVFKASGDERGHQGRDSVTPRHTAPCPVRGVSGLVLP